MQLMHVVSLGLFRGRGKGLGSKRTLWSTVAERSLGSLEGTTQQETHSKSTKPGRVMGVVMQDQNQKN